MKYLIIGAGGTGGALGAHMIRAGKDVTFIARGKHLETIKKNGLEVRRPDGDFCVPEVKAYTMDEYDDTPDVILLCVKGYSVDESIPFMQRAAGKNTIIIPILNLYGTGGSIQPHFPENLVTDGCMYIASEILEPGVVFMNGTIMRVVFGVRKPGEYTDRLETIRDDFNESGILGILTDNIRRDALLKFSYVSPHGACALYYDVTAEGLQAQGEIRECFKTLIKEIDLLASAMGISFEEDIVERNLKILDGVAADMTTSLQRDIAAGKKSELDGLIYEVVRMAGEHGVNLPEYEKISASLRERIG